VPSNRPGAAPGPGGPPQPAQQSKRLQQTQAQVDEVLVLYTAVTRLLGFRLVQDQNMSLLIVKNLESKSMFSL